MVAGPEHGRLDVFVVSTAGGTAANVPIVAAIFLLTILAALGAWLGPRDTFWLAVYASLAGGVMAVAVAMTP